MKTAMQELIKIMGVYYTKALMQPEDEKSFAIKAVLYEIMKKIDDELLEKEKEQLEEARLKGYGEGYNEGIYDAENK